MDCNIIVISGRVTSAVNFSHNFRGINYYVCWLQSEYIRHNEIARVSARIYLPENLASELNIPIGTYIKVEGSLINSYHNGHRDITVSARKVSFPQPAERPVDYVKVSGMVTRFFTNDSNFSNFVSFIVSVDDEDSAEERRSISLRVVAWSKLAYQLYETLYVGDRVTIEGSLSGAKHSSNKKPHFYNRFANTMINEIYCTACYIDNQDNEKDFKE